METASHRPFSTKLASPSGIDIDDAFDDDDDEANDDYRFDPSRLREEMKSLAIAELADEPSSNASVSTIDINPETSSEDSVGSFHSANSVNGSFVQISLSASVSGSDDQNHFHEAEEPDDESEGHEEEISSPSFPIIIIDASKPPSERVIVTDVDSTSTFAGMQDSYSTSSTPNSGALADEYTPPNSARSLPPTPKPRGHQRYHNASSATDLGSPTLPGPPSAGPSSLPAPLIELPPKPGNKQNRYSGPTALEKYRSKTRPMHLPPKARQEDDRHLADWQSMMKQSRLIVEKRKKALQERRAAREKKIEDMLPIWEKEIVPDWRVVHKNPALRKLWWKGIPTKLRASMWERAAGNSLALSKDNYRSCLARAKRALSAGHFPQQILDFIEEDIESTLPSLHIFHKVTGPMYSDLHDMLSAWFVARTDEGLGYVFGAAKVAAMLLISIAPQQAFIVMRNLLDRHCLRSFFGGEGNKDDVEAYYRIFDTLLADGMPKIYFNFKQHQISPGSYLPDWIMSLFMEHLPFEACARVWDVLLLEGDSFLFRASLGILAVLEPRLFFPDRKELLELLRGENKAAIDAAKREGRALDGGRYEIYGVDEETLWERIDSMEDWWKESTWTRLLQRELPDR